MRSQRLGTPKPIEELPLTLEDLPIPIPAATQIRLKVAYCGVCHTDLHIAQGDIHPPRLPVTLGHQVVGSVDAIGEAVQGLVVGQRVGVPWLHKACGVCDFCRAGRENLCEKATFTGFDVDGGFAEFMLAEASSVLAIHETIGSLEAAPLLCAGIVGFRSLHRAGLQPGERLGLFGFGASAHLAIQVARYWGCEVYVFTRSQNHRQHAEELGATWTGGAEDSPPHPLDRGVIFAPAGGLVPLALEKLRPGGTLAINAIHMDDLPSLPYRLVYGERTLTSVTNATHQDGVEFLKLAAEIPLRATVTVVPLENANQALADLKHSRVKGEAVLEIDPG